jgi:hypothetical protein
MRLSLSIFVALCLSVAASAWGQEGHPLKGSWIGVWESNQAHGDDIVVILDWDGSKISGMINPGTDNIEIAAATLDPEDWSIHLEADAVGNDNGALHYVIDGTIRDLELPNRYIVGSWRSQSGRGNFEIRRQ